MASNTKQIEMAQAEVFAGIVYAAYQSHFKVVLRSKIRQGEDPDAAAQRHWNENLPDIATCWNALTMGMLVNVANAQAAGALPGIIATAPAALPGLGGSIPGPDPATLPGGLARRLSGQMRDRQDAARAVSPARDIVPGLAIGRDTEQDE